MRRDWRARRRCSRGKWHLRFAYLPTIMNDGTVVWWEPYWARYVNEGQLWPEWCWQRVLTKEERW